MSYPHRFYVYADSSLETSVKGILNTYAVEYSPLPNPAQTDILKYRCNHRDTKEIEAMDVALERLGAWLVYGRMPEEMVEFEEAPSGGGEDEFTTYKVFDVGMKTDSWYQEATLYSDEDFYIQGFLVHLELATAIESCWHSWTYEIVLGATTLAKIRTWEVYKAMNLDTYYVVDENYTYGITAFYAPDTSPDWENTQILLYAKPRIYSGGYANEFSVTATYTGTPPYTVKDQYAFEFSVISTRKQYDILKNVYY